MMVDTVKDLTVARQSAYRRPQTCKQDLVYRVAQKLHISDCLMLN